MAFKFFKSSTLSLKLTFLFFFYPPPAFVALCIEKKYNSTIVFFQGK